MISKYYVLDFESYYDQEYSLRKMTVPEYLHDPRYECTGCAVLFGDTGDAEFLEPDAFRAFLDELRERRRNGEKITIVSHNALFDMCLLAWKFHFVPDLMIDTMGMARALVFHEIGYVSLAKVARHLGLPEKGDAILKVQGMRAADIKAHGLWPQYATYACNDAELCRGIFMALRDRFPPSEYVVCDTVLRCAVVPKFKLDQNVLAQHLHQIKEAKQTLLERCGLPDREALMSNDKFAEALRGLGVEPEMKTSPATGRETYAFAKTDHFMIELEEHPNPDVQALVAARLGFKSTIEETRTQRFLDIAALSWGRLGEGWMPGALRYSGAHTHRLCLTGDTIICALRDNRVVYDRLDRLRDTDFVWDGYEFVRHGGLAYAGIKEVIEYDGVTGTPDHRVWTVEHGYLQLAEAKARRANIARGGVPDPARVNQTVYGTNYLSSKSQVHLREVRGHVLELVEGFGQQGSGMVQVLCGEGKNARQEAVAENAQSRRGGQPTWSNGAGQTSDRGARPDSRAFAGDNSFTSEAPIKEMAPGRLAPRDDDSVAVFSKMYKPERVQLPLLWRAWDKVRVWVSGAYGRLAFGKSRAETAGYDVGSDRHQRPLRSGKPSMGDSKRANDKSKLVETWDLIDCGPRNCFMANGKIVHNSGEWGYNLQNLGRTSPLRSALIAPPGKVVIAGDLSQIEARLVAYVAGQDDLVEAFRDERDVYSEFAGEEVYHQKVTKADKKQRFVGKTAILGLGYGMGGPKFTDSVNTGSYWQLGEALGMTLGDGTEIVKAYRRRYSAIADAWARLNRLIPTLANGSVAEFGPCVIEDNTIRLPNGLRLFYRDLDRQTDEHGQTNWVFKYGRMTKRLYGGKLFENIIQALARIVVFNAALTLRRRFPKITLALQVHDELVYVVPEEMREEFTQAMEEALTQPVPWAPGLPLACEIASGRSYGDAK